MSEVASMEFRLLKESRLGSLDWGFWSLDLESKLGILSLGQNAESTLKSPDFES